MLNNYLEVLKKYTLFEGRAGRTEFWYFVLVSFGIGLVLAIVDNIIGTSNGRFGLLGSLYSLAVLLPSLALGCRRLHDIGQTGWLQLIGLIPLLGLIVLIFFWVQESKPDNQYGASPKGT